MNITTLAITATAVAGIVATIFYFKKNEELQNEVDKLTDSLSEKEAVIKALQDHLEKLDQGPTEIDRISEVKRLKSQIQSLKDRLKAATSNNAESKSTTTAKRSYNKKSSPAKEK